MFTQAGLAGHIGERAVTVVAQQRKGHRYLPTSAQHEDVHAAIVVVVSLDYVRAGGYLGESRGFAAVGERAVSIVMEIKQVPTYVVARGHYVEEPAILEVFNDDPARHLESVQPRVVGHVHKTANALARGFGSRSREQVFGRHAVRILAQRHIRQVQDPFHFEVVGLLLEVSQKISDRFLDVLRFFILGIGSAGQGRENTLVAGIAIRAVFHLCLMQINISESFLDQWHPLW